MKEKYKIMEKLLVVCSYIENAKTKGTPTKCATCSKDIWLSHTSVEMIEDKGGAIDGIEAICFECVTEKLEKDSENHQILPLTQKQINEIHDLNLKENGQQN